MEVWRWLGVKQRFHYSLMGAVTERSTEEGFLEEVTQDLRAKGQEGVSQA